MSPLHYCASTSNRSKRSFCSRLLAALRAAPCGAYITAPPVLTGSSSPALSQLPRSLQLPLRKLPCSSPATGFCWSLLPCAQRCQPLSAAPQTVGPAPHCTTLLCTAPRCTALHRAALHRAAQGRLKTIASLCNHLVTPNTSYKQAIIILQGNSSKTVSWRLAFVNSTFYNFYMTSVCIVLHIFNRSGY